MRRDTSTAPPTPDRASCQHTNEPPYITCISTKTQPRVTVPPSTGREKTATEGHYLLSVSIVPRCPQQQTSAARTSPSAANRDTSYNSRYKPKQQHYQRDATENAHRVINSSRSPNKKSRTPRSLPFPLARHVILS